MTLWERVELSTAPRTASGDYLRHSGESARQRGPIAPFGDYYGWWQSGVIRAGVRVK